MKSDTNSSPRAFTFRMKCCGIVAISMLLLTTLVYVSHEEALPWLTYAMSGDKNGYLKCPSEVSATSEKRAEATTLKATSSKLSSFEAAKSSAMAGRWKSSETVPFSSAFKKDLVPSTESLFHTFIGKVDMSCPKQIRPGRPGDGGYEICMLNGVQITAGSCLVYSFGIRDDWSFDDELAEKYHCEVHSFDPSIKKEDHMRKPTLHFHNMGIWDEDVTNDIGWKLRTLSSIIKELNHEQKVIDVLKMDTEGAEWPCLVDWVNSGVLSRVKQIAIEVHTPKMRDQGEVMTLEDHLRVVWIFEQLEKQGFRKYLVDMTNGCCGRFSDWSRVNSRVLCCYELFYVNTKYLN